MCWELNIAFTLYSPIEGRLTIKKESHLFGGGNTTSLKQIAISTTTLI